MVPFWKQILPLDFTTAETEHQIPPRCLQYSPPIIHAFSRQFCFTLLLICRSPFFDYTVKSLVLPSKDPAPDLWYPCGPHLYLFRGSPNEASPNTDPLTCTQLRARRCLSIGFSRIKCIPVYGIHPFLHDQGLHYGFSSCWVTDMTSFVQTERGAHVCLQSTPSTSCHLVALTWHRILLVHSSVI